LPLNEWVSSHCKAFTLLCLPACAAFTNVERTVM
jgi:hypothetical protein